MSDETPRLGLNTFEQGEQDWDHTDTVETLDQSAIVRGPIADRPSEGDYDDELYCAVDQRILWRWDEDDSDWYAACGLGVEDQPVPGETYLETASVENVRVESNDNDPSEFPSGIDTLGGPVFGGTGHFQEITGPVDASSIRVGDEWRHTASYPGEDHEARLDEALQDADEGYIIFLENAMYTTSRVIDERVMLVGSNSSRIYGTSVREGVVWELENYAGLRDVSVRDDSEIHLNEKQHKLSGLWIGWDCEIHVHGYENYVTGLMRSSADTFFHGAEENYVAPVGDVDFDDDSQGNVVVMYPTRDATGNTEDNKVL